MVGRALSHTLRNSRYRPFRSFVAQSSHSTASAVADRAAFLAAEELDIAAEHLRHRHHAVARQPGFLPAKAPSDWPGNFMYYLRLQVVNGGGGTFLFSYKGSDRSQELLCRGA